MPILVKYIIDEKNERTPFFKRGIGIPKFALFHWRTVKEKCRVRSEYKGLSC